MVALNIEVSDETNRRVVELARKQGIGLKEYVETLLHAGLAAHTDRDYWDDHPQELEALIEEGINSGPAEPWTHEDFEQMRQDLIRRHTKRGATK